MPRRSDPLRAIVDYIAGMTDRFALREHARLHGADAVPAPLGGNPSRLATPASHRPVGRTAGAHRTGGTPAARPVPIRQSGHEDHPPCAAESGAASAGSARSGFTLLEVLVAIVVLSFGLLGVVGLQAASLQANREARNQSAAVRFVARARRPDARQQGPSRTATATANNKYLVDYTGTLPAVRPRTAITAQLHHAGQHRIVPDP